MIDMRTNQAVELTLVNHPQSMRNLRETMQRVGADLPPDAFISTVSNVYHAITSQSYEREICQLFRTSGSHEKFRGSLQIAKRLLKPQPSILNLGCGTGYDLEVVREVFAPSEVGSLVCSDISPDMLAHARQKSQGYPCRFEVGYSSDMLSFGPFDLVITHSLVHHIPGLAAFFLDVEALVAGNGIYVMGHEPNHRFWNNRECMTSVEELERSQRQRKRYTKYLNPQRYLLKASRMLGFPHSLGRETQVNLKLRREHGFQADLTTREIQRLVDIHVPVNSEGAFTIGLEGFDCHELQTDYLANFERISFLTSGYLGHSNPAKQSKSWQRENARLAEKYPHDGSIFSAVWKKRSA